MSEKHRAILWAKNERLPNGRRTGGRHPFLSAP